MLELALDPDLQARSPPVALAGPAPCDDCRRAADCALRLMACAAYSLYVSGGSPQRWRLAPRAPTRERFDAIYGQGTVRIGPPPTCNGAADE